MGLEMIPKLLSEISQADLQALIADAVREGKTIEYKRDLPGGSDDNKREFLADASSFANASGGDLLFGVEEQGGAPTKLVGVAPDDLDVEMQRLNNMLRTGLEPRLPHYDMRSIEIDAKRWVLVLRLPQSWTSPHRVTFKDHSKFFGRNSSGKYPLDVGELRIAFTASEALAERIRRFREERLAKIIAQETPVPVVGGPTATLHVIPLRAFTTRETVDIAKMAAVREAIYPIHGHSANERINLEGIVGFAGSGREPEDGYTQLFRSGIFENVSVLMLNKEGRIFTGYEGELVKLLGRSLAFLNSGGVGPPAYVFLSLLNVKGSQLQPGYHSAVRTDRLPLDRGVLVLPEAVVEDLSFDPATILRPLFDVVWNAYGYKRSHNYDEQGNWTGKG